jgi:nucleotide-binding universal stress UspA family protein
MREVAMKTILVPLDGSALAEQVLPYVQLYAALLDAPVVLLRAVTPEEQQAFLLRHAADLTIDPLPATDAEEMRHALAMLLEHAEQELRPLADRLRAAGLHVNITVPVGAAADAIVEYGRHHGDTLIMMATHGYSGLRRWALGSVADKVIHAASVPVFLARSGVRVPEPLALTRVLVPLDGSALAAQALGPARELAARSGAELILLQTVLPWVDLTPDYMPLGRQPSLTIRATEEEVAQVRRALELRAAELRRPGLMVRVRVEVGYAADVILQAAEQERADVIAMATHGRSGLGRWVLGSVTDKVLQAARTPLLVVRAHEGESGT